MDYSFSVYNKFAADGLTVGLEKYLCEHQTAYPPVVLCIGSDLAIGDSLGPLVGSMLRYKTQGMNAFIYGTLSSPVTAKEIKYVRSFLRSTHKNRTVIAVDAAVGVEGDVGLIKLSNAPLSPGAGAGKKLGSVGQISLIGIVAEKSIGNYALFSSTRLGLVYSMADILSDALAATLWQKHGVMPRKTTPAAPKTTASAPCATLSPAAVNAHLGATNEQ